MISGKSYKEAVDSYCQRYKKVVMSELVSYKCPDYAYTGNLRELITHQKNIRSVYKELVDYSLPTLSIDMQSELRKLFSVEFQEYEQKKTQYMSELDNVRSEVNREYEEIVAEKKQAVDKFLGPLIEQHKELMSYKHELNYILEHYGITSNDMQISPDITMEEYSALVQASLVACKQSDRKINSVLRKIIKPLESADDKSAIAYAVLLFMVSWILLPVVSVVYIVTMVKNTRTMYRYADSLRIAEALIHTTDFERFLPQDDRFIAPIMDNSRIVEAEEEIQKRLIDEDPAKLLESAVREYNTDEGIEYVSTAVGTAQNEMRAMLDRLLQAFKTKIEEIDARVAEELSKITKLGDYSNPSTVLNTNFVIGYNEGVPVSVDYGLSNLQVIGKYTDPGVKEALKLLFVNAFLNVRANSLETVIYDSEYLGQAFAEFITPDTAPYIRVVSKELNKLFEEMNQRASKSIMACKNDSILEYNTKSESLGMVTQTYYLYILMTGLGDKLLENKQLMEFLTYSARVGVIVWVVYPEIIEACKPVPAPIVVSQGEPIVYDFDLGGRTLETYLFALKNNKSFALDYRKGYLLKYMNEDSWWTKNSIKGINLRFGLVDGDPAKAYTLSFDDKNVHCLLGGATGAGKSVAIDCTLQSMLHEYAPDEFQIVYIDMKNAEVAKYTKDGYSLLPHALIVAGTTDGEYCLSIFDWALDEMIRRLNVCKKYGVQKVEDLRKKFDDSKRDGYNVEVHIPRVLILIDEFQVMFDTSRIPAKVVDKINGRITSLVKLARAASMHLWFTSQDMKGTLAKSVLDNFSTRGALRCSGDISTSLLGNPAAGMIREKVGWMYSNDSAGQDPNANKLWRVPYAPIEDLMLCVTEMREKAEKEGRTCLKAKFFDEKEGRTTEDMKAAYTDFPAFEAPTFFVLGERTVFSTRPTPLNFKFVLDDKENLFCTAFERQDAMDLIGTMLDNIMWSTNDSTAVLINSADKDTVFLLELEKYMPEGWEDFLSPRYEFDDILNDLEEIAEGREEKSEAENSPLYIMLLMWEKKEKIGQNENYKAVDLLVQVIKRLNNLNVHFIFVSREKGVSAQIVSLCNHRICAKCDERTCTAMIDDTTPFKFPSPNQDEACFAVYKYGSDMSKFKIYRHKLERELEERQL